MPESFCFFLSLSAGLIRLGHFRFRKTEPVSTRGYECCQGSWGQSEVLTDGPSVACARTGPGTVEFSQKLFEELAMLISRLFFRPSSGFSGLPWWFSGKDSTCQCRRLRFDLWIEKIHLKKEMATHPSILAWRIHEQRSLVGYSPRGRKESDLT